MVAALLTAAICAAENPVAGKWGCLNASDTGRESTWTLVVREDDTRLTGYLTDEDVQIPISDVRLEDKNFSFQFQVNAKPYTFRGKVNGKSLEGTYRGEEASGTLRCERPAT